MARCGAAGLGRVCVCVVRGYGRVGWGARGWKGSGRASGAAPDSAAPLASSLPSGRRCGRRFRRGGVARGDGGGEVRRRSLARAGRVALLPAGGARLHRRRRADDDARRGADGGGGEGGRVPRRLRARRQPRARGYAVRRPAAVPAAARRAPSARRPRVQVGGGAESRGDGEEMHDVSLSVARVAQMEALLSREAYPPPASIRSPRMRSRGSTPSRASEWW